jgi:hypothetical protein
MKTKNKKITAKDFLEKVFKQRRAKHMAETAISKLEAEWIKDHCPVAVGVDMKVKSDKGHTSFLVTKIHVDIESAGKPDEPRFSIQFSFSGIYRGEGLEDMPQRIRFNEVKEKEDEPQSKD